MPLPLKKGYERTGAKPKCTCGQCKTCKTRERVYDWRQTQKQIALKKLEESGD